MSAKNSNPDENADLGALLYTERVPITPAVTYTILGLAFLLVGVLCSLLKDPNPNAPQQGMLVAGLVIALGGLVCLTIGLVRLIPNLGASWHLHQRGVRSLKRGQEQVLRYEDVDELTHKVVRVFFHDVCTGEVHEVTLRGHTPGKPTIYFKQVRRPQRMSGADLNAPNPVTQACDQIAASIASRMAVRLRGGEAIPWVPTLRLRSEGLELDSARMGTERIEWRQIDRVSIEDGVFRLWTRGESQPIIKLPTHLPNFFPGYALLIDQMKQKDRVV
jgi:hypothetical protein